MALYTILVVDDNSFTRKLVRVTLKHSSYRVLEAEDGESALELVAAQRPDLILQDLRLPDMDGLTLVQRIRALPAGQSIPILAFSGLLSVMEESRALPNGFTSYLVKPIEPAHLRAVVETYLPRDMPAPAPRALARLLIANDSPLRAKLLRQTFEQAGFSVVTAADGAEALAQLRAAPADLIISDVLMPRLDGFRLCLEIRRDPELGHIPIMLLSGVPASDELQQFARQAGASTLLSWPHKLQDLVAQLRALPAYQPGARAAALADELIEAQIYQIIRAMEEQMSLGVGFSRQLAQRKMELAVLAGLAEAMEAKGQIAEVLDQALQRCLDASGGSLGAIYLLDRQGQLELRVQLGCSPAQQERLADFFGHHELLSQRLHMRDLLWIPSAVLPAQQSASLLAEAGVEACVLIPLISHQGVVLGVLAIALGHAIVPEETLPFLSLLGYQIGQMVHSFQALAALRASEERYRGLVETSPEVIVLTDLSGSILFCNQRAAHFYGFERPEELLGRTWASLLAAQDRERLGAVLAELLATGQPSTCQMASMGLDGSLLPVEISSSIVPESADQPQALLHVVRDISERLRVEQSRLAQTAAEQANQAKSEFLSRMSHELRTPLNAILGFGQLMEMSELPGEDRENVSFILKSGRHLLGLINEVLDIAQIEAGKLPLSLEPVLVSEVVSHAVQLVRALLAERQLTLEVVLPDDAQCTVLADRQRLLQILLNLLSNAVKYNRAGGRVDVLVREEGSDEIFFSVSDNGMGIDASRQHQLFTPFERLGAEATMIEGTGLGLALSKRLVDTMQGRIGVESQLGKGSCFWFTLPRVKSSLAAPVVIEPMPAALRFSALRTVLLIEDNQVNLRLIERLLKSHQDIRLIGVEDGHRGLQQARAEPIDLILLDLQLPDISGAEVFQRLQNDPRTRAIPVVVLSADARPTQRERLLQAGVRAYMTKPLDVRAFLNLVDEVLKETL